MTAAGPLPFVVAVGGHRDLRDEDLTRLEARVREVLADLRRRLPHTPLVLLSSLAEGGDRLAARVALELGLALVAPLPLPREEYERDFGPASRAEFADLLRKARDWFAVPAPPGRTREHGYARAAAYMARRSQLVIALWDGAPRRHEAGTARLVEFALDGVPEGYGEPRSALDLPERRPVAHIVTPRRGRPLPARALGVDWRYPAGYEGAAEAAFADIWTRIEEFNRDAGAGALPAAASRGGDLACISTRPLEPVLACYGAADALSIHFQTLTRRTLAGLLGLAFLAAVSLQIDQLFRAFKPVLNGVYVGALAVAYAWWLWARRARYQSRHLDYRALAEGLRVQIFWQVAGLSGSAADHYLRKQRSELDWIRRAMRAWDVHGAGTDTGPEAAADLGARLSLVLDRWVRPQSAYFARSARRNDARHRRIRRFGYAFFVVALALAFTKPFLGAAHPLLVAVGLVPIGAALSQVWADRLALAPLAKQYGRMAHVFAAAEDALAPALDAGDLGRAQEILRDLGIEALGENADWVLLHRDRPVQVPGAK
jgi:hypothetical protein